VFGLYQVMKSAVHKYVPPREGQCFGHVVSVVAPRLAYTEPRACERRLRNGPGLPAASFCREAKADYGNREFDTSLKQRSTLRTRDLTAL
jgi:hypothetical protein